MTVGLVYLGIGQPVFTLSIWSESLLYSRKLKIHALILVHCYQECSLYPSIYFSSHFSYLGWELEPTSAATGREAGSTLDMSPQGLLFCNMCCNSLSRSSWPPSTFSSVFGLWLLESPFSMDEWTWTCCFQEVKPEKEVITTQFLPAEETKMAQLNEIGTLLPVFWSIKKLLYYCLL